MSEIETKSLPRRWTLLALGIACIILATCLGAAILAYTSAITDKNSQISQLDSGVDSTFGLLFSNFLNLHNQSTPALNATGATFVIINQINLDPAKWENKKVIVAGRLSGPYAYFTAISYSYVLSSDATVTSQTQLDANSIGVDFGGTGAVYNGSVPALVVGVVKKGIVGTVVSGAQLTTVYYIEEQAVLTA
jgi:hypothetical protein